MSVSIDPLVAPLPAEVPLKESPLVRVIAQLRFPEILSIGQQDFVAPFQEAIRPIYPILRQDQAPSEVIGMGVVTLTKPPQNIWRFGDADGRWRVSLAPDFLALETTHYVNRTDFVERLKTVVQVLDKYVKPAQADRLGLRYINRLTGKAVDDIATLVRPEVCGIAGTAAAKHAAHIMSQSMFEVEGACVLARWGSFPPNAVIDPTAFEAVEDKSWILDLDMFSSAPAPFGVDWIAEQTRRYAERIYTIFRWAITEQFLSRYGGKS